jgi:hypothetical protein
MVLVKPLELADVLGEQVAWRIVAHYVPRLSLIVFAELFAYFFLKLYKEGLADIKYYQNELSNIDLRLTALKAALTTRDNEILKIVIGELAKTERNFVLKSGESTVELEKYKSDGATTKQVLEQLGSILKSK